MAQNQMAYDFVTEDGSWTVGLTREFIALSTTSYVQWEEFRAQLEAPLRALVEVYGPGHFTRIGLRYQNVIRRSILGGEELSWAELLRPQVTGVFAAPDMSGKVEESFTQMLIQFPDGSAKVRIRHGIMQSEEADNEECYVIDNDFFTEEKAETDDATRILDHFNQQSGHLFRWCISDRLHQAMGPSTVESDT